jgi:hypothetical protein
VSTFYGRWDIFLILFLLFALAQEGLNRALGDVHCIFVSKFLWYFFILKISLTELETFDAYLIAGSSEISSSPYKWNTGNTYSHRQF